MYTRTFSTLGCAEFSLDEVITLGQRHDISAFEVRALSGTLDLPTYFSTTFGAPTALAQELSSGGARIVVFDTSFRVFDGSDADRRSLLEFLPWAEALGVRWLRVFDGGKVIDVAALAQ